MNQFYRLVWHDTLGCWVPVAEIASRRGKRGSRPARLLLPLAAALGLCLAEQAQGAAAIAPPPTQLPTGGKVVAGGATIASGGASKAAVLNVDQSTQRAVRCLLEPTLRREPVGVRVTQSPPVPGTLPSSLGPSNVPLTTSKIIRSPRGVPVTARTSLVCTVSTKSGSMAGWSSVASLICFSN
jgi:Extended Signal Peptide of Type V secretion system